MNAKDVPEAARGDAGGRARSEGLGADQEGPGATPRNLDLIFCGEQVCVSKCKRGDLVESELCFLRERTGR